MTRVAINGFGRIGRLFFRQAIKKGDCDIVAINDLGDIEQLAYLLQYDTVYGRFSEKVQVKKDSIVVAGKAIRVFSDKDPMKLPWRKLKVDVVVEATGAFSSFKEARVHIKSGAKRVVITAPAKDAETKDAKTVLMGVNEKDLAGCVISSNGSCTTNAAAVVLKVISNELGIKKAVLNAAHGYTATQS
ncbi:MAG TPA: type I glyceraldehyde-3-phosphate dehydrogenase, partial [Candidatus Wildermuthbacteria bacterium]|nr:type I glyceraldehyde-3-phosphate dehydrogenase [Candidatus Wildermuthbacteria bacterium]